jgi:hypothetical protein
MTELLGFIETYVRPWSPPTSPPSKTPQDSTLATVSAR